MLFCKEGQTEQIPAGYCSSRIRFWLPSEWGMSRSGFFPEGEEASLGHAHALQQVDIARIAMPLLQGANNFNNLQPSRFFRQSLAQPDKGLLLIAERSIDVGNVGGIHVTALCQLLLQFDFPR